MASLGNAADWSDPANLLPALQGYPELASAAAWSAAKASMQPTTDIVVQLYSNFYKLGPTIGDYISLETDWVRNDIGTATIVLPVADPSALPDEVAWAMNCTTAVVPITIQNGVNMRWSGRVNSFALALESDTQMYTCTLQCIDDYAWLSRMLVWPDPFLPIQVQFPSYAVYIGPAITCILTAISENALRLQTGMWEIVNDILSIDFDWEAWFGVWLESNGSQQEMLQVPIVTEMINPLYDTSPWIAQTGRMDKISTWLKQTLMDYGLSLEANLWLPGDPQPGQVTAYPFVQELVQPCIVMSCQDRQGVVGPTGTFLDGLIEDSVSLTDSIMGQTLSPFLNPNNAYFPANLGINIAPALGVNFVPPWVIFNGDVENNGLLDFKLSGYAPIAVTVVGGGTSPQWLNSLINATLEFLIDAIEITVGFTGIPDSLLNGTFDNIILAFQMIQNFDRWQKLGPYAFQEYFTQTGASAYTVDEWFALMQGMFDTQGYSVIELSFENGFPYTVGRDIFVGSLVSFVLNGQLTTDYVYKVTLQDDRKQRAVCKIVVGDGKREVNPILRTVRLITGIEEVVNVVMMSTGSSGSNGSG